MLIHWIMSYNELITKVDTIMKTSLDKNDKISSYSFNENNIKDFLKLLSDDINDYTICHSMIAFLVHISPNENIRKTCMELDYKLTKHANELNMRIDIYKKLKECSHYLNKFKYPNEDIQFINRLISNYERNGIDVDDAKRSKLLKVKHEITKLENSIMRYIIESDTIKVALNKSDITGLPQYYINKLTVNDTNKYIIPLDKHNYALCMNNLSDSNIRRKLESAYSEKYNEIVPHICKLIVLKDKFAKLQSYNCYSDYKAEMLMTKNSSNIKSFLTELLNKLDNRYKKEYDTLLKFKKRDDKNSDDILASWDIQYYTNMWKKKYGIDDSKIREYFELSEVLNKIFIIYKVLFNITFKKIDYLSLWHNDVVAYEIKNNDVDEILGIVYFDLFARPGKYKSTRCFILSPPIHNGDNNFSIPHMSLVASFDKNNAFLSHHEVMALFHELCHICHNMYGTVKYSIFGSINLMADFVEIPAQILEFLCYEKNLLVLLSSHYRTNEQLPVETIEKLIKIKNLDIGMTYKKNIMLSLFDQLVFSSENFINLCEKSISDNNKMSETLSGLYKQMYGQIMCYMPVNYTYKIIHPDTLYFPVEWITQLDKYGQYYSNVWSRVLAADVYTEKFKGKEINKTIGYEFRDKVLKYGGIKPSYEVLCDYINRKPIVDGFIQMYDLDVDPEYSFFFNTDKVNKTTDKNKITESGLDNIINKQTNRTNQIKESPKQQTKIIKDEYNEYNEYNNSDDSCCSVLNRFSEINESSVDFSPHKTEKDNNADYMRNKLKKMSIEI